MVRLFKIHQLMKPPRNHWATQKLAAHSETQQAEKRSCSPWQSSSNLGACHVKRLVKALIFPSNDWSKKQSRKMWVCLKIVYIPNYSHLIGIMIINPCEDSNYYGPRMVMESWREPGHPPVDPPRGIGTRSCVSTSTKSTCPRYSPRQRPNLAIGWPSSGHPVADSRRS